MRRQNNGENVVAGLKFAPSCLFPSLGEGSDLLLPHRHYLDDTHFFVFDSQLDLKLPRGEEEVLGRPVKLIFFKRNVIYRKTVPLVHPVVSSPVFKPICELSRANFPNFFTLEILGIHSEYCFKSPV